MSIKQIDNFGIHCKWSESLVCVYVSYPKIKRLIKWKTNSKINSNKINENGGVRQYNFPHVWMINGLIFDLINR